MAKHYIMETNALLLDYNLAFIREAIGLHYIIIIIYAAIGQIIFGTKRSDYIDSPMSTLRLMAIKTDKNAIALRGFPVVSET